MYLPNDINSNDPPFDPRSGIYADTSTVSRFFQEKSWLFRLAVFETSEPETSRLASVGLDTSGAKASLSALAKIALLCRQRSFGFATFFYREQDEPAAASRSSMSCSPGSRGSAKRTAFSSPTSDRGGQTATGGP